MANDELAKKTTWFSTDLDGENTQFMAFPVVKLDGKTATAIVRAEAFEIMFQSTDGRETYNRVPTNGVYLIKTLARPADE